MSHRRIRVLDAALLRRKALLEARLERALAGPDPDPAEIEDLFAAHDLAAKHARAIRRRRTLRWSIGITAVTAVTAAALSLWRLDSSQFVLNATTSALLWGVGSEDEELLTGATVDALTYLGAEPAAAYCSIGAESRGCIRVEDLMITALTVFQGSTARLAQRSGCTELVILDGGGQLQVRARRAPADEHPPTEWATVREPVPVGSPEAEYRFIRLQPSDRVRYCEPSPSGLILVEPRHLVLGDTSAPAVADRVLLPAAPFGELVLPNAGKTRRLEPTEILLLEELRGAVVTLQPDADVVAVTLSARAGRPVVLQAGVEQNANPTLLDLVLGSPALRASLGLLLGVWTALTLLRSKLEELTG